MIYLTVVFLGVILIVLLLAERPSLLHGIFPQGYGKTVKFGLSLQDLQKVADAQGVILDSSLLEEYPIGTFFWCVHHDTIVEPLNVPLVNRIACILIEKPADQRQIRLAALRPVKDQSVVATAWKAYNEAIDAAQKAYEFCVLPRPTAPTEVPCWKVRDDAYIAARKVFNEVCFDQWTAEYPGHPAWGERGLKFTL